jgi:hypothetical protein
VPLLALAIALLALVPPAVGAHRAAGKSAGLVPGGAALELTGGAPAWIDGLGPVARTDPPRWVPRPRPTWQWQLSGRLDSTVAAHVYDIDLFDHGAAVVARLKARARRVVCYTSLGTAERGRADAGALPRRVIGKPLPDWPGERWLDVRRLGVLRPWIERRLDLCRRKGFDAVEPDNVDAYANDSGFPLSAGDQLRFNRFVARAAHARGLAVALKNDLDQAAALEPDFDFAIVEQCFEYDECDRLAPFVAAGKPVLVAEYALPRSDFCRRARAAGLVAVRKRLDLGAWRRPCW